MTTTQTLLTQQFPQQEWQFDKVLAPLTYFKIGGPAEVYWSCQDKEQLQAVITFCHQHNIRVTLLAGASNVIIDDNGIPGLVIHLTNTGWEVGTTEEELTKVKAGAGLPTALVVRHSIDAGLTGLEYFLGVPGNLGGAVVNNAHYDAFLIGQYITQVEVISAAGESYWLTQAECDFAYDHSRFQTSGEIIWQVEFALEKGDHEQSKELIAVSTRKRASTQPLGEPSSGCVFKNVPNTPELKSQFPQFADRSEVPTSFLIDQAGLKGTREGDIEISPKHAAFFINTAAKEGKGSSKDVLRLIEKVKQTLKSKYNVELEEEVFYLR